jgi:hypothetical protein
MELSREQIIKYLKLRLLQGINQPSNEQALNNLPSVNSDTIHRKALFLFSLTNSFSVTAAVRKVGMARSTYHEWYSNDLVFKEMVDEVKEMKIDFFEDALIKTVKDKGQGYARLIEFALKTIGKTRGYTEEVTSYEDDEVNFTLHLPKKLKPSEEE